MKVLAAIGLACVLAVACGEPEPVPAARGQGLPSWALDPARPGRDMPVEGRSLFDFIIAGNRDGMPVHEIPASFDQLVRRIEQRVGCSESCTSEVLIPLGRSLQRTVASPDFFMSPRVVVAVTGEGVGPVYARDRIYLGYQPRANVIEVISYNETAARFEFQLVKNYRPGARPEVVYADRAVCIACHQNHGPMFSRQVWDETNANPAVAALLSRHNRAFRPVPVEVPNAIDDATDRANAAGVVQRLWTEACDATCRKAALAAAMQYRLSGERAFEREPVATAIAAGFRNSWPDGLAVPNPDIPNRDPFSFHAGAAGLAQSHVSAPLEPLLPRAPLETWRADDPQLAQRFVTGLARLFAEADVGEMQARLAAGSARAVIGEYRSACTLAAGDAYDCRGEVTLRGDAATLDSIAVGTSEPVRNLKLAAARRGAGALDFRPGNGGQPIRLANGNAIAHVALRWNGARGEASVVVKEDFAILREAVSGMEFPDKPFNRAGFMSALDAAFGLPAKLRCCEDASALPPARVDVAPPVSLPAGAAAFRQPCGACHATSEPAPPNFLAGDAQQVGRKLAHCAPRLYARLGMWDLPPGARDKVPMPPPQASRAGHPWIQETPGDAVLALKKTVSGWLHEETGEAPDLRKMLLQGYENLRPCLPAGA